MDGAVDVSGTSRPADGAAPVAACYPVELPITFEDGAGVTLVVGREEVRFATDVALAGGRRVAGLVRFPAGSEVPDIVLRYVARVTGVRPLGKSDAFEVSAWFGQLHLAAEGVA